MGADQRARRWGLAALGAPWLAVPLAVAVDWFGHRDRARAAPALVVLGAKVHRSGAASDALIARVEHGAALYRAGLAPLVVLSGGKVGSPKSEAEVALELAVERGVPREACLLEDQSRSTYENACFTAALLRARGVTEVVLVSDAFHLYRARQHFRRAGLVAHGSPALCRGRALPLHTRALSAAREAFVLLAEPELFRAR